MNALFSEVELLEWEREDVRRSWALARRSKRRAEKSCLVDGLVFRNKVGGVLRFGYRDKAQPRDIYMCVCSCLLVGDSAGASGLESWQTLSSRSEWMIWSVCRSIDWAERVEFC